MTGILNNLNAAYVFALAYLSWVGHILLSEWLTGGSQRTSGTIKLAKEGVKVTSDQSFTRTSSLRQRSAVRIVAPIAAVILVPIWLPIVALILLWRLVSGRWVWPIFPMSVDPSPDGLAVFRLSLGHPSRWVTSVTNRVVLTVNGISDGERVSAQALGWQATDVFSVACRSAGGKIAPEGSIVLTQLAKKKEYPWQINYEKPGEYDIELEVACERGGVKETVGRLASRVEVRDYAIISFRAYRVFELAAKVVAIGAAAAGVWKVFGFGGGESR